LRKRLLALLGLLACIGGVAAALALGDTTGTVSACATATAPSHTVGVDSTDVYTIPGTTTTHCETTTYTVPTSTVTSTVTTTPTTSSTTSTSSSTTSTTSTTSSTTSSSTTSSTGSGTSVAATPSSLTDGGVATVTINDAHNNANDYVIESSGTQYVNWFYVNSCTQTPGSTAVTFNACSITTGQGSPGSRYTWALYGSTGSLLATSNAQTLTPDATIGTCGSSEPSGSTTLNGHSFTLLKRDDFSTDASSSSFASNGPGVRYTGSQGMQWGEYADGSSDTFGTGKYYPSQVQSVHDGVLDWYLHDYAGAPASANPSPYLSPGNQYETYGAFSLCEKVTPNNDGHWLDIYKQALLLWPSSDAKYQYAESDFPEGNMADAVDGANGMKGFMCYYAHYGGSGSQATDCTDSVEDPINLNAWHVYTQAWGPGWRAYYIDGNLISKTTTSVWGSSGSTCTASSGGVPGNCGERWQLQVEEAQNVPSDDGAAGHVYVDWAAVWRY
jgi:hypothetical protein